MIATLHLHITVIFCLAEKPAHNLSEAVSSSALFPFLLFYQISFATQLHQAVEFKSKMFGLFEGSNPLLQESMITLYYNVLMLLSFNKILFLKVE